MIANPGRDLDEILTASIARKLDADPHLSLSLRKLAYSLGIAPLTVCPYSAKVLRMKYQHLR
jgi:hypothetical protein